MTGTMMPWQRRATRDFFDGFLSGVEAEHRRRGDTGSDSDGLPFSVEWKDVPHIDWGETERVINPRPRS